jgi:hypothetical protein
MLGKINRVNIPSKAANDKAPPLLCFSAKVVDEPYKPDALPCALALLRLCARGWFFLGLLGLLLAAWAVLADSNVATVASRVRRVNMGWGSEWVSRIVYDPASIGETPAGRISGIPRGALHDRSGLHRRPG